MIGALLIAAAVLIAACSAPQLAYDRLDRLAPWHINKYLDLSAPQRQHFERHFAALWAWHRDHELTRYAEDLRALARSVEQPLTEAQLALWIQRVDTHWNRTLTRLAPAACAQLSSLNDPQVRSVLQRLDRNMAEDRKKFVTPAEAVVRKESERRLLKTLHRWLGDVDDVQRRHVARWSVERELTYALWLEQRRSWRDNFENALTARRTPGFCDQITRLFTRPGQPTPGALPSRFDGNRARWLDFLAELSITLTGRQRQHLHAELVLLAKDLETLAAKSSG